MMDLKKKWRRQKQRQIIEELFDAIKSGGQ